MYGVYILLSFNPICMISFLRLLHTLLRMCMHVFNSACVVSCLVLQSVILQEDMQAGISLAMSSLAKL